MMGNGLQKSQVIKAASKVVSIFNNKQISFLDSHPVKLDRASLQPWVIEPGAQIRRKQHDSSDDIFLIDKGTVEIGWQNKENWQEEIVVCYAGDIIFIPPGNMFTIYNRAFSNVEIIDIKKYGFIEREQTSNAIPITAEYINTSFVVINNNMNDNVSTDITESEKAVALKHTAESGMVSILSIAYAERLAREAAKSQQLTGELVKAFAKYGFVLSPAPDRSNSAQPDDALQSDVALSLPQPETAPPIIPASTPSWKKRSKINPPTPAEFIKNHYGEMRDGRWRHCGVTRQDLSDNEGLYSAYSSWINRHPEDALEFASGGGKAPGRPRVAGADERRRTNDREAKTQKREKAKLDRMSHSFS